MKAMKKLAAAGLAVAMVASLAACDTLKSSVQDEGKVYLQGIMDNLYLGQQNEDYLKLFEMTPEEATQEYQDGLQGEAYRFAYTFNIQDLNDEVEAQVKEVLAQVYKNAKYSIISSSKLESGNYAMEVEIEPIDVMTKVTDDDVVVAWEETLTHFDVTQEDLSSLSDEEYYALDNYYAGLILDQVRSHMDEVGYLPKVTMTMTLREDSEGYFDFSQDDFDKLDAKIMPYFDE